MPKFRKNVAIDLGTASVQVYVEDKGIVLDEASVIAKDVLTNKILAIGNEAKNLLGRTSGNVVAIRPIERAVISDMKATEEMLKYYLSKSLERSLFKPDVLITIPSKASQIEKRAVLQAAENTACHRAYLIEKSLAAGLGAGLEINDPLGSLLVDFGAGSVDIAVISMGQIVISNSLDLGSDDLDQAIIDHIRDRYHLIIGQISAQEIKIRASELERSDSLEIRGRRIEDGLPTKVFVPVEEIYLILLKSIDKLIEGVKSILEATPPQLASDIYERGLILTGSSANTIGLSQRIEEKLQIKATIAKEADKCTILGAAKALTWIDSIDEEKSESMKAKQRQLERNERLRRR